MLYAFLATDNRPLTTDGAFRFTLSPRLRVVPIWPAPHHVIPAQAGIQMIFSFFPYALCSKPYLF
jgi:hypothetical protein